MYRFRKPRRSVARIFIHCSASDNPSHDSAKVIDQWHKARRWSGIGYHFFIRKSGQLEEGRALEKIPAAQGGKSKKRGSVQGGNRGTIAICLHGLEESRFTAAQFATLQGLCTQINDAYGGRVTFHGHREVAYKACPVFDYKRVLNLDSKGRLGRGEQPAVGGADPNDALLRYGHRNALVGDLQTVLNDKGYHCGAVDSHFGGQTRKAVLHMKADNGLATDTEAISINQAKACMAQQIAPERADAPVAEVIEISDTAQAANAAKGGAAAKLFTGAALAGGGLNLELASDAVDKVEHGQALISRAQDVVSQFTGGVLDTQKLIIVGGVLIAGLALYSWWQAHKALMARVDDHRSGANL